MTLFMQNDSGTFGAGTVFPIRAFANIVEISNMDGGIGQDPPVGDLIPVIYAQTVLGTCPNRLNTLVNTDFTGVPGNVDIIIIATDSSFTLSDGRMLTNYGGLTFPLGNAENPTGSVVVLYDTSQAGGGGYCLKGQVSGANDLQTPNSVILYHELSHAFRAATSSSLDRTPPSACGASPEEMAAEVDENDMRDQLAGGAGLHRDVTDHCGDVCPGGSTANCCIVASIATGSPYSAEVNALRQVRDRFLRRSNVGYDFFDKLHSDYYDFSPEVCRMMAVSDDLLHLIEVYFVKSLTLCLNLLHDYTVGGCDPQELGERFENSLEANPDLVSLGAKEVRQALHLLNRLQGGAVPANLPMRELETLLRERAGASPYVRWALMDTMETYLNALAWRLDGASAAEIGNRLARSFDEWAARLPLTDVWKKLSKYAIAEELDFLKQTLFRTEHARLEFGSRLANYLSGDQDLSRMLSDKGYFSERVPS